MTSPNTPTTAYSGRLSRFKGLAWMIGAIALIFTFISLAPIISHHTF